MTRDQMNDTLNCAYKSSAFMVLDPQSSQLVYDSPFDEGQSDMLVLGSYEKPQVAESELVPNPDPKLAKHNTHLKKISL